MGVAFFVPHNGMTVGPFVFIVWGIVRALCGWQTESGGGARLICAEKSFLPKARKF